MKPKQRGDHRLPHMSYLIVPALTWMGVIARQHSMHDMLLAARMPRLVWSWAC